jgi:hypothetical protein
MKKKKKCPGHCIHLLYVLKGSHNMLVYIAISKRTLGNVRKTFFTFSIVEFVMIIEYFKVTYI